MAAFIYIPEEAGRGRHVQRVCRFLDNVYTNSPDLYKAFYTDVYAADRILTADDQVFIGLDIFDYLDVFKHHLR